MQALDGATGHLRPVGAILLVALCFAISFVTPYLIGSRLRLIAREEVPPGVRPRRQWAISGLSITIAFALPLLLFGSGSPELELVALLVVLAGLAGMLNDVLGLPRPVQALLAGGIAWFGVWLGIRVEEIKPPFTTHMISLGAWSVPASIAWLMAVVYAVVLCRRLPKLTAGLVAIIALTFALAALVVGPSRSAPAAACSGWRWRPQPRERREATTPPSAAPAIGRWGSRWAPSPSSGCSRTPPSW